jgi:hypothetical protein
MNALSFAPAPEDFQTMGLSVELAAADGHRSFIDTWVE